MLIAILGRQSEISIAELVAKFGADRIKTVTPEVAVLDVEQINQAELGGTLKLAEQVAELKNADLDGAFKYIAKSTLARLPQLPEGKLKLGISVYGFNIKPKQQLAKLLEIKKTIKSAGRSVRIIENRTSELSSAQVLYNKLTGELGWELLIVRNGKDVLVGQTVSVQDIDEYTRRDRDRPARDARVGMLPPKLAQIMINLTGIKSGTVYDPFCGTGVVLQEASLMRLAVAGSDLEPRMIDYTQQNLHWLNPELEPEFLSVGDATSFQLPSKVDAIASEMFLGKPLTKQPSANLLDNLLKENRALLQGTLENFSNQTAPGTMFCLAVPAWKQGSRHVSVLDDDSTVDYLKKLGYTFVSFKHIPKSNLIYARSDQIVGRRLLVLRRT